MFQNRVWALFLIPFIALISIGILYKQIVAAAHSEEEVKSRDQFTTPAGETDLEALTTTRINFCSQHANKCPLNEASWPGEEDAWNYTGKKWIWHPDTPTGRNVIWIWNRPYVGSTPAYEGQREAHYSDFTSAPNESPDFKGSAPFTYDYERWEPVEDNQKLHQYGWSTEAESWVIGETDCEMGVYYPVINHQISYDYTPMSIVRGGECISGGYISTYRKDLWDGPLSQTRVEKCDDADDGVPASHSPAANILCKYSPYVGVVEQRYVWQAGPPPDDQPVVGCEVAVYAWGWPEPSVVTGGQDYQARFRNGELRFSRWINLTSYIQDEVPAPDDHTWWNQWCDTAWYDTTNELYTGIYKIGSTVYTDTIISPVSVSSEIPIEGGELTSTLDSVAFTFPPGTFTETVTVTYTIRSRDDFIGQGGLSDIAHMYALTAVNSANGLPAEPSNPYTVTIQNGGTGQAGVLGNLLALRYWDGNQWVKEPSSMVLSETNTLFATPSHFSLWGVQVDVHRVYLPYLKK